jgi:hypothetical protein
LLEESMVLEVDQITWKTWLNLIIGSSPLTICKNWKASLNSGEKEQHQDDTIPLRLKKV